MDMLALVVNALGNENGVLGVEFINEPFPGTEWTKCRDSIIHPFDFSAGCEVFDNALFSWHNYMPTDFSSVFKHADDHQKMSGSATLITEFGASQNVEEWSEVLSLSDRDLMSWMFWAYTNNPPYKIAPIAGFGADGRLQGLVYDALQPMDANLSDANKSIVRDVNLDVQRIEALSRPYLQWTAGTPKSLSYDENSSLFSFTWSFTEYIGENADTEIFVPKHRYPDAYKISVKNCSVISNSPDNQKLILRNKMEIKGFDAEVTIISLSVK